MMYVSRSIAAVLAALALPVFQVNAQPDAAAAAAAAADAAGEAAVSAEAVAQAPSASAPVAVLEPQQLVEAVGYYMAHASGIASLQLDEATVAKLSEAVQQVLAGELDVSSFGQDAIQSAISEASARGEAIRDAIAPDATEGAAIEPKVLDEAVVAGLPGLSEDTLPILGAIVAAQSRMGDLGFSEEEIGFIAEGFKRGAADVQPSPEILAGSQQISTFLQARSQEAQARLAMEAAAAAEGNKAAGAAFIEALEGVESTDSGLHFEVVEEGEGPKPTMEDNVRVHYEGTRIDGTVFDSSYERGEPADFPMGGVVPGFSEGLTKIGVGGKVKLYIPSDLAYGDDPRPGGKIEPGDTLIFEAELLEINPDS